jgi:hypothetical protein
MTGCMRLLGSVCPESHSNEGNDQKREAGAECCLHTICHQKHLAVFKQV